MDPADMIELNQLVHFSRTKTSWTMIERLSKYPDGWYKPTSQSFKRAYVFRVELAGSKDKVVSTNIPKYAVLKIKARQSIIEDAVDQSLLREVHALEQMAACGVQNVPRVLDAKVEQHLTCTSQLRDGIEALGNRSHFVTYTLMTEVGGVRLTENDVWEDKIPTTGMASAFRDTIGSLHRAGIVHVKPSLRNIRWDPIKRNLYIVDFTVCEIYERHTPSLVDSEDETLPTDPTAPHIIDLTKDDPIDPNYCTPNTHTHRCINTTPVDWGLEPSYGDETSRPTREQAWHTERQIQYFRRKIVVPEEGSLAFRLETGVLKGVKVDAESRKRVEGRLAGLRRAVRKAVGKVGDDEGK